MLLFSGPLLADVRPKIVLSGNDLPVYRRLSEEIMTVLNQYSTDYTYETAAFPPKRIITAVNLGQVDGSLLRPDSTDPDSQAADLVKVPTPVIQMPSMFAINAAAADISSLEQVIRMKIGMVNGSVHSARLIPKESRVLVSSVANGLMMVKLGRVDAMSTLEVGFYGAIAEAALTSKEVRLATLRVPTDFFVFVHKRKAALIPKMDALLQKPDVKAGIEAAYARLIAELKRSSVPYEATPTEVSK